MRVILMPEATAQQVDGQDGEGAALDPRKVDAGPYAGRYVLPVAVLDDPAHAAHHAMLSALPQAEIDAAVAWPEQD